MRFSSLRANWPWLAAALLVLGFLARSIDVRTDGDPRPVGGADDLAALSLRSDLNLVFILIDTLRADRLGSYGYERATSPLLDQLAATGIRFDRHLAQSSWTKCSMASLWTSLQPTRSGVTRFDHALPPEARLPAEIFRDAGFRTAAIYRNGWVAPNFGFAQGFEVYHRPAPRPLSPLERRENQTLAMEGSDVSAVESAIAFLRANGSQRFFLYLHLMDVHEYVYDEETAIFGSRYSDVYDQAILRVNHVLEPLLRQLWRDRELAARTAIAIGSDHGEGFGERGSEGHARNVYAEVSEIPFILALPFRIEGGLVLRERSQNVDVWPTLLDLFGLPALAPSDGRSLRPQIQAAARGEPAPSTGERGAYSFLDRTWGQSTGVPSPQVAVARGEHRLVSSKIPEGRLELFDRRGDRFETRDRKDEEPELTAELASAADALLAAKPAWSEAVPSVELDEMELNQLRALGYSLP
jgi:arylsulfatase A-like enzyme